MTLPYRTPQPPPARPAPNLRYALSMLTVVLYTVMVAVAIAAATYRPRTCPVME